MSEANKEAKPTMHRRIIFGDDYTLVFAIDTATDEVWVESNSYGDEPYRASREALAPEPHETAKRLTLKEGQVLPEEEDETPLADWERELLDGGPGL